MIIVVVTDPSKLPCIVKSLRQVRLHVEVETWCGQKTEAELVLQVPDGRTCPACETAIKGPK